METTSLVLEKSCIQFGAPIVFGAFIFYYWGTLLEAWAGNVSYWCKEINELFIFFWNNGFSLFFFWSDFLQKQPAGFVQCVRCFVCCSALLRSKQLLHCTAIYSNRENCLVQREVCWNVLSLVFLFCSGVACCNGNWVILICFFLLRVSTIWHLTFFHSGGYRNSLFTPSDISVRGRDIHFNKFWTIILQDNMVLLCHTSDVAILQLPWDAAHIIDTNDSSCFHFVICCIHPVKSVLRLPSPSASKYFVNH